MQALSHNFYLTFSDSFKKLKFSPILFEFVSSFVFIFPTGPFRGLRSGPADVAPAGQALSGQLASQPPQLVFVLVFAFLASQPLQLVFAFVFAFLASQPPQLVFVFQILSPFPSVFTCCCSLSACPTAICTVNTVI